MSEIEKSDRMVLMNTIVEEYILKGVNNATTIAKSLGIPRRDVLDIQEEWKLIASNDEGVKMRARELLTEMDRAYDQVIARLWEAVEEAEDSKAKTASLKVIADVISKRQDTLQKAGLYDDATLGDELAMAEEQMDMIKELLKSLAMKHPEIRIEIMQGLSKIFNESPSVPLDGGSPTA